MPMARYLPEVAEEMLSHIPETEEQIIADIKKVTSDSAYAPPEAQSNYWGMMSIALRRHIPVPKEDWHFLVLSVFLKIPIAELKTRWAQIVDDHPGKDS